MQKHPIEIRLDNYILALIARAKLYQVEGRHEEAKAIEQIADELSAVQGNI